jgi:Bacteriocin-protection, YdeI or OmpD-Associated/Domain of unknown function (DUF1905)
MAEGLSRFPLDAAHPGPAISWLITAGNTPSDLNNALALSFAGRMRKGLPALLPPFTAKIKIIGINPHVLLPGTQLKQLFTQTGKDKGAIPVRGTLDGHAFLQTLVKFRGKWRLYLNGPMRKSCGKDVGDTLRVRVAFDPVERMTPMPPALAAALKKNPDAEVAFNGLSASRRKEIMRYIGHLKSDEAVARNVQRAVGFLLKRERFAGRGG